MLQVHWNTRCHAVMCAPCNFLSTIPGRGRSTHEQGQVHKHWLGHGLGPPMSGGPPAPPSGHTGFHQISFTGGWPGPVLVCDPPQPPPPRVLKDSDPPHDPRPDPPPNPRQEHPPPPPPPDPRQEYPPPQVLKDSWGVGRIRTGCSRPPVISL